MKSRKKLMTIFLILFFGISGYAQTKLPAKVFVYREKRIIGSLVTVSIDFNDNRICELTNNSKLEYSLYSEGKIKITAKFLSIPPASIVLNVKSGNSYYVSVRPVQGAVILRSTPENPEKALKKISDKNSLSLIEDELMPIIDKPVQQQYISSNTPQVVYAEKSKDKYKYMPVSDIGKNVPENKNISDLSFALIIGNEDYASYQTDLTNEMNVEFARNDASAFKNYSIKTLGIPERNITFLLDATYGQISQALTKMNLISKSTDGKATLYFYYAGHGLPDQNTRESYLMPVDVSGSNLSSAINLKDVYSKLTEHPSEKVIVFLDACFTGGGREQGLLSARAVRVRPKEDLLKGNLTVFASSSGEQTSLPYREQQHGLFTYYLLKKIQETKGELTLKELSDYLTEKISLESILINNREQTPKTNVSHGIENKWQDWKLIEK
ncbi:MAG: caspase family protein [Bacteroidales bacterium]